MVSLTLGDIQGNILRGYNFPRACYLFLHVTDPARGRDFIRTFQDRVTNAKRWKAKPRSTLNLAFTYEGLRRLGVESRVLEALPEAFREPIGARARRVLNDVGSSAPEHWDANLGTGQAHVLVAITECDEGGPLGLVDIRDDVMRAAARCAVAVLHHQEAESFPHRREHFGWADGFGQPAVEGVKGNRPGQGVPLDDARAWRDIKPGEFVFGYPDEDDQVLSGPARPLLLNGSFMVYRKLHQDVALFRAKLHEEAQRYGRVMGLQDLEGDALYEFLAAKVMGRWRDGVAIELKHRRGMNKVRLGDRHVKQPDNDFRYGADRDGFRCPKGAHIRRTNPRDAPVWGARAASRHRIIRRGMPYGSPLPRMAPDDGASRGLIFIAFNADLERQFETIQADWCDDGNAFGLGTDKDYVLGDDEAKSKSTVQGRPPYFLSVQRDVVVTKACEYLLMPGIEAIREIAGEP